MRTLVAASLLVLPMVSAGCVSGDDIDRWWGELGREPQFEDAVLFNETVPFDLAGAVPTGPPSGPESFGATYQNTFDVPAGTRQMQVLFLVNFTAPPGPPGTTNPVDHIVIYVEPPTGGEEERTANEFDANAGGSLDTRRPEPGTWTLGFEQARGLGEVRFVVEAVVPVNATAATSNATLV